MATLNFIMPGNLKEGFCKREEKKHKVEAASSRLNETEGARQDGASPVVGRVVQVFVRV